MCLVPQRKEYLYMLTSITRKELSVLGLNFDWEQSCPGAHRTWCNQEQLNSKAKCFMSNKPFNFRCAPFSLVQSTATDPKKRSEFRRMVTATCKTEWDGEVERGAAERLIGDTPALLSRYDEDHELEHCFSRLFVYTTSLCGISIHEQPITPDYERGTLGNHDFRSVERLMNAGDNFLCEPEKIICVAEWQALLYYSSRHIPSEPPFSHSYPFIQSAYPKRKAIQKDPKWVQSEIIYWPSDGLYRTRLLRVVREAYNKRASKDLALLLKTAALVGVKVDKHVTTQ